MIERLRLQPRLAVADVLVPFAGGGDPTGPGENEGRVLSKHDNDPLSRVFLGRDKHADVGDEWRAENGREKSTLR